MKTRGKRSDKTTTFRVKEPATLMAFLLQVMPGISRNKVKAMLSGQSVKVEGVCRTAYDCPLETGMVVEVGRQNARHKFQNRYVRIVWEDAYLIVVEKREGILTNRAFASKDTVQAIVTEYLHSTGQRCSAHVVHRLDRDTSGLLVFTKDKQTELLFEADWKGYVTDRRYIAVLSGVPTASEGTLQSWLKENRAYKTYSSPTDNGGKLAITHYRVLQANEAYALAEFQLETGRKNQIRVHCADMGCPVVGDKKYGNGDMSTSRLALHAYRLAFTHPITGEALSFETSWPIGFRRLVE